MKEGTYVPSFFVVPYRYAFFGKLPEFRNTDRFLSGFGYQLRGFKYSRSSVASAVKTGMPRYT